MATDPTVAEVRRRLAAPPARVFAAFADPALVPLWLTPSPEVGLRVERLDFRVGGGYRFAYHVPGRPTMFVHGVYRVIDPPLRLAFSWCIEAPDEHAGIDSDVTVLLTPDGPGTALLIRHERLSKPGAAARHAAGWEGALAQLAGRLEVESPPDRFGRSGRRRME
jgi:uncharacterized protein YndB with AHSA1/START domain